jgi:hypothetical protein
MLHRRVEPTRLTEMCDSSACRKSGITVFLHHVIAPFTRQTSIERLSCGRLSCAQIVTLKLTRISFSNVRVLNMDSGLLRLNPNQTKRPRAGSETTCPQCNSRVVYRTKRRGILERIILYPLGFRSYQCYYCLHRFCSRAKPIFP